MKKTTHKRGLALLLSLMLLLSMLPTAAFAAGNTIYTDMSYKGVSDGSEAKPYAKFEDALNKAKDGDTIIIKGKAFANAKEESGVTPLVISKSVTITGENGAMGELYVRAGGIMLGADVTMRDVELNLANKYHNAIFVNGYRFTAENVTRGSGSREVHLFAGGIGAGTQVTDAMPASGSGAALTLTNSSFGSIYAGGVASGFTGDVAVTASGCKLGAVYGSGAAERAPDGNWFDVTEPPAPTAEEQYAATGSVSVSTDARSVTTVEAKGSGNVAVTVDNADRSRVLTLTGVKTLSVNGGAATVAALDAAAAVTISGDNATLDISKLEDPTLGSLSGGGKLIMDKMQTLNITGDFNGKWTFETSGGFNDKSGVAEYGHTYITFGSGDAALSFTPHDTQSTMTLVSSENSWKTSAAPKKLSYVTTFAVQNSTVTTTTAEINRNDDTGGAEFSVAWTNPSLVPQLTIIPLHYEITWNGKSYQVDSTKDEGEDGFYSAHFDDAHMLISADDTQGEGKGLLRIEPDGTDINAGVYQFSVFAPDAAGGKIQQNFTLIVTDDGAPKTATTVSVTVQDAQFGDKLQATVEVKAGDTAIPDGEVEYYINGRKLNRLDVNVLNTEHFNLGENELRVVYKGSDAYAPSVGTVRFQVAKATNTQVFADLSPVSNKPFDGKAVEATLTSTSTVRTTEGTVLDSDAKVSIEYQLDDKAVKEVVVPGIYTVELVVAEGEMYGAFTQAAATTITIKKAKPAVTVDAVDRGNGVVELTAEVEGVAPYTPTGTVSFLWDGKALDANLSNGSASYRINDAKADTLYTYKAAYTPATDDRYYAEAESAEESLTAGSAPAPGKGTVTADLFDFNAPALTFNGNDQSDTVKAAVRLKDGLAGKVGEITVLVCQMDIPTIAQNAGTYDVYVTAAEGTAYEALTVPLKLGSVPIAPKTITATVKSYAIQTGDKAPDLTAPILGKHYTVDGLFGSDTLDGTAVLTYKKNGAAVTLDTSAAGSYDIVLSGVTEPAGGNYKPLVLKNGTLTITARPSSGGGAGGSGGSSSGGNSGVSGGGSGGGGATEPTYPVASSPAKNGAVSLNTHGAAKGSTVTITVKPDDGYKLDKLTVTDQNGNRLSLNDQGNGKYTFTMPAGKVSVEPVFAPITAQPEFKDVENDSYYYDAVQWAVEKGITEGTGAETFSPHASCTRAQTVTFLWRVAGAPEPENSVNPFSDLDPSAYYYKAVLWAIENGITSGTGADTFSPGATVDRGQTVTFLHRAAGSPLAGSSDFNDVSDGAYYAKAVAWANENSITDGTGNGKFTPNADCTRAQIVTLLYRAHN